MSFGTGGITHPKPQFPQAAFCRGKNHALASGRGGGMASAGVTMVLA